MGEGRFEISLWRKEGLKSEQRKKELFWGKADFWVRERARSLMREK